MVSCREVAGGAVAAARPRRCGGSLSTRRTAGVLATKIGTGREPSTAVITPRPPSRTTSNIATRRGIGWSGCGTPANHARRPRAGLEHGAEHFAGLAPRAVRSEVPARDRAGTEDLGRVDQGWRK